MQAAANISDRRPLLDDGNAFWHLGAAHDLANHQPTDVVKASRHEQNMAGLRGLLGLHPRLPKKFPTESTNKRGKEKRNVFTLRTNDILDVIIGRNKLQYGEVNNDITRFLPRRVRTCTYIRDHLINPFYGFRYFFRVGYVRRRKSGRKDVYEKSGFFAKICK